MREFLILTMIIVVVVFLAPMIIGVLIFSLCVAAIVILLARLGFLPGFRYVRYGGDARRGKSSWKWKYQGHGGRDSHSSDTSRSDSTQTSRSSGSGWYQASQDGEEVTLPETALRKENDPKNNGG
jgi:hypothetical protein